MSFDSYPTGPQSPASGIRHIFLMDYIKNTTAVVHSLLITTTILSLIMESSPYSFTLSGIQV